MRRAAEIDPEEARSRAEGALPIPTATLLDAAEQFRRSATEERNASVASSAMALLLYHLGDAPRAMAAVERALRADGGNQMALVYEAQLALDRGDPARARDAANRLLAAERSAALGHLMLARGLARQGRVDDARLSYEAALRSDPGLLSARAELASLDLSGPEREKAVAALVSAFQIQPSSRVLRRLLFEAGL
jgi:tetratricopeptide (TPR) repeat protein